MVNADLLPGALRNLGGRRAYEWKNERFQRYGQDCQSRVIAPLTVSQSL